MTGFKPCPICGAELSLKSMRYMDCEGVEITELESMVNPSHPAFYRNMEAATGARFDREEWRDREGSAGDYRDMLDAVRFISLDCDCGFSFFADRGMFPERGWLEEFRAKANRRSQRWR